MPTYFYLEKLLEKVKEYVPYWLYRELHYAARAYAGGKSKHVKKVYNSIDELPESVKKLPKKKQRQWMHVFNSAYERYDPKKHRGTREEFAFANAWAAVQKESDEEDVTFFAKDSKKQIAYGVVYAPDEVDAQGDYATAEAIEDAAHKYMIKYREGTAQIKMRHKEPIQAYVVESWIAPEDLEWGGIRKGTWVMAVHVPDPEIWAEIEKGAITGFSMGGWILDSEPS